MQNEENLQQQARIQQRDPTRARRQATHGFSCGSHTFPFSRWQPWPTNHSQAIPPALTCQILIIRTRGNWSDSAGLSPRPRQPGPVRSSCDQYWTPCLLDCLPFHRHTRPDWIRGRLSSLKSRVPRIPSRLTSQLVYSIELLSLGTRHTSVHT